MTEKDRAILNEKIRAYTVLLIGEDGTNYGEIALEDAKQIASDKGLDILQVSHQKVPTCKLINYGKFLYEQSKKSKYHKPPVTKGMRTSYAIDNHDLKFKHAKVREFLAKGQRVAYSMILEGREKGKLSEALSIFGDRLVDFDDVCEWKKPPNVGSARRRVTISTTLTPLRKK